MANNEVFMDVPKVMEMGRKFENIGQTVKDVSNALQAIITVLKATAFVGLFGNFFFAQYLESLKPRIDKLAEQCIEIGGDLGASANAYQRGDAQGSTRFF